MENKTELQELDYFIDLGDNCSCNQCGNRICRCINRLNGDLETNLPIEVANKEVLNGR